jgi:hypothetical protein
VQEARLGPRFLFARQDSALPQRATANDRPVVIIVRLIDLRMQSR